jgi:hypothetical protein
VRRVAVFGTIAIAGLSLATLASGAQERAGRDETTTVDKNLPVRGFERVGVDVFIGTIHVYADSPDTVRMRATRSVKGGSPSDRQRWLTETRVEVQERDGELQIKDVVPEELRKHPVQGDDRSNFDTHLNLELHMPRRLALTATSTVGDVEVDGQGAELKIKSTAGKIRLKHLQCAGRSVDVRAGAGNITLEGQVGNLMVTDGAGNLDLSRMACTGDQAEVKTGAGNVTADFTRLPAARCRVDVGAGNVVMNLPAQVRARLQLNSGMGVVRSAFSSRSEQHGRGMGGSIVGEVNGGGTALDIHVGMGDIHVEKAGDGGARSSEPGERGAEIRAHRSAQQDVVSTQDPDKRDQDAIDRADRDADAAEERAEKAQEAAEAKQEKEEKEQEAAEAAADRAAEKAEKAAEAAEQEAERNADRVAEQAEKIAEKEAETAEKEAEKQIAAAEKEAEQDDASADQDDNAAKARARRDARNAHGKKRAAKGDDDGDSADADLVAPLANIGDEFSRQFKNGFPGQDVEFSRQIEETVRAAVAQALEEATRAMEEGGRAQQEADQAMDEALHSLHGTPDQNREARQAIESARRESRSALLAARRALREATQEIERALRDMPKASQGANDR